MDFTGIQIAQIAGISKEMKGNSIFLMDEPE
jgi:hypothetical protein